MKASDPVSIVSERQLWELMAPAGHEDAPPRVCWRERLLRHPLKFVAPLAALVTWTFLVLLVPQ